mgnify:CR=1 FL=1
MEVVADPVSVPDLFATICATLQVNPNKNLMDGAAVTQMDEVEAKGRVHAVANELHVARVSTGRDPLGPKALIRERAAPQGKRSHRRCCPGRRP